MANQNIRKPRFYVDLLNHLMARGIAQNGNFDVADTGGSGVTATRGIQTGVEAQLFDMRPSTLVSFDTAGDTDSQVVITIDTQGAYAKTFIAILNHNMKSADAKVRISRSGTKSHMQTVNFADGDRMAPAEIVNADDSGNTADNSSSVVEPATDGSTLFTFSEITDRYIGIQFEGTNSQTSVLTTDGTFDGSTDLTIGCVLIGEYFDMPVSPDLAVTRSIIFDSTKQQKSLGGQTYSTMINHGRNVSSTSKAPFSLPNVNRSVYGGRLAFDMNFSYLASTDIMPDEYHTHDTTDDAVIEDVWNRTNGNHIPFIFSVDNTSTGDNAESEHIFARFDQNKIEMKQVALDTFNVSLKIKEEF